ncbi:MAG: MBL fold metallo-hydrolase [Candidatus Aquicultorales bacterium]
MLLETLVVGFNVNCYFIASEQENEAIVVDPGADARRIFDVVSERQSKIRTIVCTHGHFDHTGGADQLAELTGAEIVMHAEEIRLAKDPTLNLSESFGKPHAVRNDIRPVEDGDRIVVGEMQLKVLHTPGHTPGSICLLGGEELFCGDIVFAGSVGRVDLPGGSWDLLLESVRKKILTLPDRVVIYPGHGPSTTIGEERKYNPYLVDLDE